MKVATIPLKFTIKLNFLFVIKVISQRIHKKKKNNNIENKPNSKCKLVPVKNRKEAHTKWGDQ